MNKTTTNGRGKARTDTRTNRRGRANPSRQKMEPVAEWEAEVHASYQGTGHAGMRRKVRTRGIRKIDVSDLFDEAKQLLKAGYEVRLTCQHDGESIRLYPCLDADYSKMFVAAQTMGSFRTSVAHIPFRMMHCDKEVDPVREGEIRTERAKMIRERKQHAKPDMMVTCPNCSFEFRVGERLDG